MGLTLLLKNWKRVKCSWERNDAKSTKTHNDQRNEWRNHLVSTQESSRCLEKAVNSLVKIYKRANLIICSRYIPNIAFWPRKNLDDTCNVSVCVGAFPPSTYYNIILPPPVYLFDTTPLCYSGCFWAKRIVGHFELVFHSQHLLGRHEKHGLVLDPW